MKKGLSILFLMLVFVGISLVSAENAKIYIKVDVDDKAIVKFADVGTETVYDQVPIALDYPGYSVVEFLPFADEVKVIVYLKNKETGQFLKEEGQLLSEAFSPYEDLYLDYTGGVLRVSENPDKTNLEKATVEETAASNIPTQTQEELASQLTGNAIASTNDAEKKRYWISGAGLIVLLSSIAFMIIQHNKQKLLDQMPEEKELLQLKKREEIERKAVSKVKTEAKLREEILREKKKVAMKLAVEEAELSEIGREGSEARRREAERFDRRNLNDGKKGFY